MRSTKADKRSEQQYRLAEQPEEESQRRLLGLSRKITGSTPMEEKWYVKTERRQDYLPYFLTEMFMSVGGKQGRGTLNSLEASKTRRNR